MAEKKKNDHSFVLSDAMQLSGDRLRLSQDSVESVKNLLQGIYNSNLQRMREPPVSPPLGSSRSKRRPSWDAGSLDEVSRAPKKSASSDEDDAPADAKQDDFDANWSRLLSKVTAAGRDRGTPMRTDSAEDLRAMSVSPEPTMVPPAAWEVARCKIPAEFFTNLGREAHPHEIQAFAHFFASPRCDWPSTEYYGRLAEHGITPALVSTDPATANQLYRHASASRLSIEPTPPTTGACSFCKAPEADLVAVAVAHEAGPNGRPVDRQVLELDEACAGKIRAFVYLFNAINAVELMPEHQEVIRQAHSFVEDALARCYASWNVSRNQ
jgi:hypothetical protein